MTKTFIVRYDVTERTVEEIEIEADTEEEALRTVTEYEFDNSKARSVESLEWSLSDARIITEDVT